MGFMPVVSGTFAVPALKDDGSGAGATGGEEEVLIDGSPVKAGFIPPAGVSGECTPGGSSPGSVLGGGGGLVSAAAAGSGVTPVKMEFEAVKAESERRKALIRAAMQAGTYEDEGDVCINCSS